MFSWKVGLTLLELLVSVEFDAAAFNSQKSMESYMTSLSPCCNPPDTAGGTLRA